MNITAEELVEIQKASAAKALESVETVRGLKPIEGGVMFRIWRDPATADMHWRFSLRLGDNTSSHGDKFSPMAAADDQAFKAIVGEVRDHIEAEVERLFGEFLRTIATAVSGKCRRP